MSERIKVELVFKTREGTYRLKARVTPGSQTAQQLLEHIDYLEKRAHQYQVSRTPTQIYLPA